MYIIIVHIQTSGSKSQWCILGLECMKLNNFYIEIEYFLKVEYLDYDWILDSI